MPTFAANQLRRKAWTAEECEILTASGIDLSRYELLEGELIEKIPKGHAHTLAVMLLFNLLSRVFGEGRVVAKGSIRLADRLISEPEPDVMVLNRHFREIRPNVVADDVLLVIEVSAASLPADLKIKSGLYARENIADYWVLDLTNRRFLVHRQPNAGHGSYERVTAFAERDAVSPLAATGAMMCAADFL